MWVWYGSYNSGEEDVISAEKLWFQEETLRFEEEIVASDKDDGDGAANWKIIVRLR